MKPLKEYTLCITAAEPSGDLIGREIIAPFENTPWSLFGVTGPAMAKYSIESVMDISAFSVMGFSNVLKKLPSIVSSFFSLKKKILDKNPQAVITIDAPDLSLRLHSSLKKSGYKGFHAHIVLPTIWAWKKKRLQQMETLLDHIFYLFPFEKEYLLNSTLSSTWIGHPLIQMLAEPQKERGYISFFPGSRKSDLDMQMPWIFEIIQSCLILKNFPLALCIPSSFLQQKGSLWKRLIDNYAIEIVSPEKRYQLMQKSYLAFAKSGTSNLELAHFGVPSVILYAVSKMDYYIARYLIKLNLPYVSILNWVAGKRIFPEHIGCNLNIELLKKDLEYLLDYQNNKNLSQELKKITKTLVPNRSSGDLFKDQIEKMLCK